MPLLDKRLTAKMGQYNTDHGDIKDVR